MLRIPVLLVLFSLSLALAAVLEDAHRLYVQGQFQAASEAAAALNSAEGYVLAARALGVLAEIRPRKEQELILTNAEQYAATAIKLDARNPDAYVERARASGRLGVLRGVLRALADGTGTRTRSDLQAALELNPRHASAMVGLAAWHAGVVAGGGGWLYGADARRVEPLCVQAIQLEPGVINHRLECARSFLRLENRSLALTYLRVAVKLVPTDAAERIALQEARSLLQSN
jgi:hypothetical protein